MIIAVPKETFPHERRVALVPTLLPALIKAGHQVKIESGAGLAAGFPDQLYADKGATLVHERAQAFDADCVLQVRALGANPAMGGADLPHIKADQIIIGMCDPLTSPRQAKEIADRGATLFALELVPRTTRAQSMDVLSSMASIAGYRAVLLAASTLPKMFPMMTTAAGTITPAKVFIIGAGVAGLQAIATARRLGAVVSAYDVRPVAKEQVQSLGAKFIEMQLDSAEGQGGYAKAMDEEFYRKQRELMLRVVAENDVVITTAAIPGKKSPILVTEEMVKAMPAGSCIIDLAAERGGNCELTRADETVLAHNVTILGPANLSSEVAYHASQMFGKNITTFLANLLKDGKWNLDTNDEIIRDTLVTQGGQVVHPKVREALGA